MKELLLTGLMKAKYLVISYNDQGIITKSDWDILFMDLDVRICEIVYDTFKGCRNLEDRSDKVKELIFIASRQNKWV
jgi:adenine-specific DNA methylase